jgi:hypothetical protein
MGADDYLLSHLKIRTLKCNRNQIKACSMIFYSRSLEQLDNRSTKRRIDWIKKIIAERKSRLFKKESSGILWRDSATGIYLVGKIKTIKMTEEGRELMTNYLQTEDFFLRIMLQFADDTATALKTVLYSFFLKHGFVNYYGFIRCFRKVSWNSIQWNP